MIQQAPFCETTWYWLQPEKPWLTLAAMGAVLILALGLYWLRIRQQSRLNIRTKWVLFFLRLGSIGLIVFSMIDWHQHKIVKQPAELLVVLDQSKSADHVDATATISPKRLQEEGLDEPTRFNSGRFVFLSDQMDRLDWLQRRYQLRFATIGASVQYFAPTSEDEFEAWIRDLQPTHNQSRLGDGLREVMRHQAGKSTAAIVCFTDGINTHGQSLTGAAEMAQKLDIPLYVVGWGDSFPPVDLAIDDLRYNDRAFLDDLIQFNVRISAVSLNGRTVVIRLIDDQSKTILDSVELEIEKEYFEGVARLNTIAIESGKKRFRIEAVSQNEEVALNNNVEFATVDVRDETIRVLMVHGYPSNEFRFLKQLFSRQISRDGNSKTFKLDTIMQQSDPGHPETDEEELDSFPDSKEQLAEYDLIIIGDAQRGEVFDRTHLNDKQLQMIQDFVVKQGGCVIFIGGPDHMPMDYLDSPLNALFPFSKQPGDERLITERTDPTHVLPTEIAQTFPPFMFETDIQDNTQLFQRLQRVNWWQQIPTVKDGVFVLATATSEDNGAQENFPLITYQIVNSGRVVYHGTDELYQWRRLVGDQYYARYWLQLARFLCREELETQSGGSIETDQEIYTEEESIDIKVELPKLYLANQVRDSSNETVELILYKDSAPIRTISLKSTAHLDGSSTGTIQGLPIGRYRIQWNTAFGTEIDNGAEFEVIAADYERKNLVLQEATLRQVAEHSGGAYFHISEVEGIWDQLPKGNATVIERMPPRSAWVNSILAFAFAMALIGLLTAEWIIRKRNGLV
jgi:uncharacterized membrane protein